MFVNYLKIAFRSLMRQKFYTLINLIGLSFGIAAFVLILLHVQHELSFDKHLSKIDRLFRVVEIQNEPGVGEQHVAITMGPLAEAMKQDFPQVVNAVRLMGGFNFSVVSYGDKYFNEPNFQYADPSVIDMFDIEFLYGDGETALSDIKTVVLSKKVAEKYFGDASQALGKMLMFDKVSYRVSAVMKDQPETSHFFFDMLSPIATAEALPEFEWMKRWGNNSLVTYVELDSPDSESAVNEGFKAFLDRHVFIEKDSWQYLEMYLQPVKEVYLKSGHIKFQSMSAMGDARMVTIFIVVSLLILLIACVNFINIAIARSVKRSREVGMRKVLGAGRGSLITQFISESAIITLISLLLALGIVELVLPELNKLLGTSFSIDFTGNPVFNIGLLLIFIFISLTSGYYPAFYLSRLQPVAVLKGVSTYRGKRGGLLSKVLVVFQFVISIGLIMAVYVIHNQVSFVRNKDIGINYQNVLYVGFGDKGYEKLQVVKSELMQNPDIRKVAGCSFLNGVAGSQGPVFFNDSAKSKLYVRFGFVDEDFFDAMGIKLADGRNFDGSHTGDINRALVVNEATLRAMGWDNALQQSIMYPQASDSSGKAEIVGVIKDYHYYSLRSQIEPAVWGWQPESFRGVVINFRQGADINAIKAFIEQKWKDIFPGIPVQITDAAGFNAKSYKKDQDSFTLFIYFTLISILLSCLGLFGLISLVLEQKTRSIGIRKVLGGEVWQITIMLIKEYLLLVLVAGIIALPLGYYLLGIQLDAFAYHITIGFHHLLIPVLAALIIAFSTVIFRARKAANSNPVDALKYE